MQYIHTTKAPAAVGSYSQGIVTGSLLYTAGQIGITPSGELLNDSIENETRQIMSNLEAILKAANCHFGNVVQVKIYISTREIFPIVNRTYAQYFSMGKSPARECVIAAPPIDGAHLEISMIAEIPPRTS